MYVHKSFIFDYMIASSGDALSAYGIMLSLLNYTNKFARCE